MRVSESQNCTKRDRKSVSSSSSQNATTAIGLAMLAAALIGDASNVGAKELPSKAGSTTSKKNQIITRDHLKAAKHLMKAMGYLRSFELEILAISERLAEKHTKVRPKAAKTTQQVFKVIAQTYTARKSDALRLIAPLYAQKFTVAELDQVRRFYASSLGQKFVHAQPEIQARSTRLGAEWARRLSIQMQRDAQRELKRLGVDLTEPAVKK